MTCLQAAEILIGHDFGQHCLNRWKDCAFRYRYILFANVHTIKDYFYTLMDKL